MAEVLRSVKGKIKTARDKSYLGCYSEALQQYEEVLALLSENILNVKEPSLKLDWQKLIDMMNSEKTLVLSVSNPLASKPKKRA
jgi:hypothetical protein